MPATPYSEELYRSSVESKTLPAATAEAQVHSEKLLAFVHNEIDSNGGAISFQDYMQHVLYAPGLGYYSAGSTKLGDEGDFITAPEISPLFSQALANAILPVLKSHPFILEVGAGRGRMAADMLAWLQQENTLPDKYYLLELSADLQQRQKATIAEQVPELLQRVEWLQALPEKFSGVVLGNELLDAMPVQLFLKKNGEFLEHFVGWEKEHFVSILKPAGDRLRHRLEEIEEARGEVFAEGYHSEVNFAAEDFIRSMAQSLQQGIMIFIDYGFPRHEYYHPQRHGGTLMCHYRHRAHPDPFVYPGLQDITAHVDFTAMADAALESGMKVTGYTNQAGFLMGAGLLELPALQQQDTEKQIALANQIKKLTLPHEMGELFKVIAFSKQCDIPLPAFALRDLREYL